MKNILGFTTAVLMFVTVVASSYPAWSHNVIEEQEVPVGYRQDLSLRVTHGCKGQTVKEVRVKIPEGIEIVRPIHTYNWEIETTMRPLPGNVQGEGGIIRTEVVDQIIWKNPKDPLPDNMHESFKFNILVPEEPNKIIFFKSINVCEDDEDAYVDLPEEELNLSDPRIKEKLLKFLEATPTPSAFIITRPVARNQYPGQWTTEQLRGPMPMDNITEGSPPAEQ